MKITGVKFSILALVLVCVSVAFIGSNGWEVFASHTDPIAGWKSIQQVGYKPGEMTAEISPIPGYEVISDDVQKFVNELPVDHFSDCTRRWCYWIEDVGFYEDGTGQHAVSFRLPHEGTWLGYVLIYDKNNKRAKAVRYVQGHYAC